VLSLIVNPWLLLVGVAAIAAAVLYTGGPAPLGYLGLGELMVLVFFGFVATVGSAYVQVEYVPGAAWWGSLVVGLLACAILLANNVRDVPTDTADGKRTLAVAWCPARAVHRGSSARLPHRASASQPWALLGLPPPHQPSGHAAGSTRRPWSPLGATSAGGRGRRPRERGAVPV
jgi:1,4-dihydroxy-2-naphthoate octaprenyltransferase